MLADFVIAALGLAIGWALGFFSVKRNVVRWLGKESAQGPDHVAKNLRGRVLKALIWPFVALVALVLLDMFVLKNSGTIPDVVRKVDPSYPNTGGITWSLWSGWGIGLVVGASLAAMRALKLFPEKYRRIGFSQLVGGLK